MKDDDLLSVWRENSVHHHGVFLERPHRSSVFQVEASPDITLRTRALAKNEGAIGGDSGDLRNPEDLLHAAFAYLAVQFHQRDGCILSGRGRQAHQPSVAVSE